MSLATINQSLLVPDSQFKKIYSSSTTCRNNLVFKKEDNIFVSKVCCVCDRHIIHGNEKFLPVKCLENKSVQKCLKMDNEDWALLNATESIKSQILMQYKQKFVNTRRTPTKKLLDSLILSPQIYGKEQSYEGDKCLHLGCCTECNSHLKNVYNGNNTGKPPFAIANNKCFCLPNSFPFRY